MLDMLLPDGNRMPTKRRQKAENTDLSGRMNLLILGDGFNRDESESSPRHIRWFGEALRQVVRKIDSTEPFKGKIRSGALNIFTFVPQESLGQDPARPVTTGIVGVLPHNNLFSTSFISACVNDTTMHLSESRLEHFLNNDLPFGANNDLAKLGWRNLASRNYGLIAVIAAPPPPYNPCSNAMHQQEKKIGGSMIGMGSRPKYFISMARDFRTLAEIFMHELGHCFNLDDEYDASDMYQYRPRPETPGNDAPCPGGTKCNGDRSPCFLDQRLQCCSNCNESNSRCGNHGTGAQLELDFSNFDRPVNNSNRYHSLYPRQQGFNLTTRKENTMLFDEIFLKPVSDIVLGLGFPSNGSMPVNRLFAFSESNIDRNKLNTSRWRKYFGSQLDEGSVVNHPLRGDEESNDPQLKARSIHDYSKPTLNEYLRYGDRFNFFEGAGTFRRFMYRSSYHCIMGTPHEIPRKFFSFEIPGVTSQYCRICKKVINDRFKEILRNM